MAHSYVACHVHCIFSTKERKNLIARDLRERLWPYMGGIARQNDIVALAVGGTDNHAHLLLSLPGTMQVSKAVQLIKGGSSKWIHDTFPAHRTFQWQEGYGGFSVSSSLIESTAGYIANQPKHHGTMSYEEEFLQFLKKYNIDYDAAHVFG